MIWYYTDQQCLKPLVQPFMRKPLYLLAGMLSLLLGAIGAVLPLLPTTPFVLLAAFCFSRSSKSFHQKLLSNKLFGPMIIEWERHGVIPLKIKCLSSSLMLLMVSYSVIFRDMPLWLDIIAVGLVIVALSYIWTRPSVPVAE